MDKQQENRAAEIALSLIKNFLNSSTLELVPKKYLKREEILELAQLTRKTPQDIEGI